MFMFNKYIRHRFKIKLCKAEIYKALRPMLLELSRRLGMFHRSKGAEKGVEGISWEFFTCAVTEDDGDT